MIDWLKPILGDGYNEEIDNKIRRLPKVTGFALRSIQNTVGRLQAPDFRCWTSSRNRAGKTFKCARRSACGM